MKPFQTDFVLFVLFFSCKISYALNYYFIINEHLCKKHIHASTRKKTGIRLLVEEKAE